MLPLFAQEAVFLKQDDVVRLKIPASNPELSKIEDVEDVELYVPKRKKDSNYFDEDDSIFESRAGKAFSKLVDKWAIDNKVNDYSFRLAE